ncbi:hypothetical protein CEUSTIGMA_g9095.t1 [Chlamydomonas eustigma]|uniref:Tyrosine decarboxylase n=1 Tax=Chlamydomonas eustigma TaxID=1157962 RepID=A0A250XF19_9CHLO|nr:hypothetical protein CEUSTIGMA_g9095.t1 [Chlamydomonas eustigma]|eukprot:GAX81667.1 hypothetical protein CEUSTIGMA_g9095.t1 [Chlamydomonas eustigma]
MKVSFRLRSSKSLSHFKSGHTAYRAANHRAFNLVERFHRRHVSEIEDPVVLDEAAQTEQTEGLLDDISRAGCSLHNPDPALLKDYTHPVDMAEFRKLGYEVVDWISDYFTQQLSTLPVKPNGIQPGYLPPLLEKEAPEEPQPWSQVFQDFKLKLLPGAVHWQHPLFFAYFPANTSTPAMLADMLAGAINMIGFSWAAGPVSTELEMVMMDWLGKLCGIPEKFLHSSASGGGGVIQGTASEASIVSILAARAKIMKGRPEADKLRLVAYSSNQAHSAFKKACMIADIDHVREIPATSVHHFALQPEALERVMQVVVSGFRVCFRVDTRMGLGSAWGSSVRVQVQYQDGIRLCMG